MQKRPPALKKIHTIRDLRGEVYKILRTAITNGVIEPGTRLKEVDLGEELAVSRTPIREALNQLSKEGLVKIIPRKGAFVVRWTKQEALEVLILREALEGLAGRLATAKMSDEDIDALEALMTDYENGSLEYVEADRRFHEGIVNACGMERLKELIGNLYDSLQMGKVLALSFTNEERISESMAEHRNIISALRVGDEDEVEKAIKDNFQKTRAIVEQLVEE
jgi:DNA-binding GntR family transcriptional regulator